MTCFCGCDDFEKNPNGQFLACVKCGHGRQNHDDKFRESARANEEQSQKRDADFLSLIHIWTLPTKRIV